MTSCQEIFSEMPARFNADAAQGWETEIQFEITGDGGGSWLLSVKDGVCSVSEGSSGSPTATLHSDAATWVGVHTGTVNPMMAFMGGKIRVEGNTAELMRLQDPKVFRRD